MDVELRERLAEDPSPARRLALARLLLRHGLALPAIELAGSDPELDLRLAACKLLWPDARRSVWEGLAAHVASEGHGREAFDLCLLAGREELAAQVASRTPGVDGARMAAELELRHGRLPDGAVALGALHDARAAHVRGDLDAALREASRALEEEPAEAAVLAASIHRRRGDLAAARALLERARASTRVAMPGIALEALLQHLAIFRLSVPELDVLEPLPWLLGERADRIVWWPFLRPLAKRLRAVDEAVGACRGEILTRRVGGRLVPYDQADDLRFRGGVLRMGLRVAELDEVLETARRVDAAYPGSPMLPAYQAELLHWHGRHEEAGALCEEALRRDPHSRWPWIGLAQARMWTGDPRSARATLRALSRERPDLPSLPAALGELTLLEGDADAAITLLTRAVSLHPTRRATWLLLARAFAVAGRTEESRRLADSVRASAPDAWFAGDLDVQLAALRGNRSSSFVTLFPPSGGALLLDGSVLPPVA